MCFSPTDQVAPSAGTVNIAVELSDHHTRRATRGLHPQGQPCALANDETDHLAFNVATSVTTGEAIDFVINRGAAYWDCDSTGFDPVITYVSP